jgi:hypothetical protein
MCNSTNDVSIVMLRPKNLEIQNDLTVKTRKKPQTECHEIDPKMSKDRAMHEGDNPLF